MDEARTDPGLSSALEACGPAGRRAAAARLRENAAEWAALALAGAMPALDPAAQLAAAADLRAQLNALGIELAHLLDEGPSRGFEFVRDCARRLAANAVPVEAGLAAYRGLHALAWREFQGASSRRERAAALAEVLTQYFGTVAIVFSAAYVAHVSVAAEAQGDRRAELLSLLVGGLDASNARVLRLFKRAGYLEPNLNFCVALAQSHDPLEMENPARAQRIVDAVVDCVGPLSVRVLVGVRNNLVTAVFSDRRRLSGWTAAQASLADRVRGRLLGLGPAVLVGLSGDLDSAGQIARGLHEATVALDFAKVGERVMPFGALPIRRLLIHHGGEYVRTALPAWFTDLRDADVKSRASLVSTLRAMADADLNVQGAARALRVHPNTVYARLARIEDLTGLNAQRYHDIDQLLLAVDCGRL